MADSSLSLICEGHIGSLAEIAETYYIGFPTLYYNFSVHIDTYHYKESRRAIKIVHPTLKIAQQIIVHALILFC
jgi:hypothetical protein